VSVSAESKERCAKTNANGEYALPQLHAGQYAVEFGGSDGENLDYVREYYGGKASLAEANMLSVTPGITLSVIDASMHAVGEVKEEKIEPPHSIGTTLSPSLAPTTPLIQMTPLVTLVTSKLMVSEGAARVRVACGRTATCQGSIELVVPGGGHGRDGGANKGGDGGMAGGAAADETGTGMAAGHRAAREKTLVLATGSFSLAEGHSRIVVLRLTASGRRMLAHAGERHPIAARLVLSVKGGEATSRSVLAL
jgi:hypothetical protein